MGKIGTISKTKEILDKHQFRIKKKYGQNFLTDQNILHKIVQQAAITKDTLVIEIGPGIGSLTELLMKQAGHVLAYEIDGELIAILQNSFINHNVSLIHDDFLHRKIDEDIQSLENNYQRVIVVANLPYYITTPIIMKLIEESHLVTEYYVMMQYEVAKRFTSKPSTKDYNSLSVFIQYKTESSIVMKIPKAVFIPAPNVDSAVVKMKIKVQKEPFPTNELLFYKLVKSSFGMRRKTLVNNISHQLQINKKEVIKWVEDLSFSPTIRAENLTVSDFVLLANHIDMLENNIQLK